MTLEPGPSGLEILRAARHLVQRFGVIDGARRAGVHASTLRAAARSAEGTQRRTARRIVRAGRAAGAFDPPCKPSPIIPAGLAQLTQRSATVVSLDEVRLRRMARARQ